ncbi:MAG: PAS domain S-box protein [Acidimicrobiia bacterium]
MRHRLAQILLWAHIPGLVAVGLALGTPTADLLAAVLVLSILGVLGTFSRSEAAAATAISIGLISAAGVLVFLTGGVVVSSLYFLVMIVAISMYRDWRLLALGVVYVTVYELGVSTHPATGAETGMLPGWWAILVSGSVLATASLLVVGWWVENRTMTVERNAGDNHRLAFAAAPALALLKPSGELIEANPAMADLLGYETGDLTGIDIRGLVHEDDLSELGAAWEEMGNGESHDTTAWMRCTTRRGHSFWAQISLSLVARDPGLPAVVVLQIADITRAHDTEMRLERIIAGKDEFVAAIGDELRVPLGSVIDLTRLEDDPKLREIGARAREMSSVVDDLVISARYDAGTVAVVPTYIDSADICREALSGADDFETVTQELRPLQTWADPEIASQIVKGLISNATRLGGTHIVLRTVSSGPDTVIQVIDDGPEIPMSDRHRIFSSDLRTGRPVTRPASVGLGLTVGRRLARQMDGDIAYRRTNGNRNVFELRLPADQPGRIREVRAGSEPVDIPA